MGTIMFTKPAWLGSACFPAAAVVVVVGDKSRPRALPSAMLTTDEKRNAWVS